MADRIKPRRRGTGPSLVRALALERLRELRTLGFSLREIGYRYLRMPAAGVESLEARPQLSSRRSGADQRAFLEALDLISQPIALFTRSGTLLHGNRPLRDALHHELSGPLLQRELTLFAASLAELVRLRGIPEGETVANLSEHSMAPVRGGVRLLGSHVGLDLSGRGPTLLISIETHKDDPLSEHLLHERFSLTRQEIRVVRLVVAGCSDREIGARLFISEHTARHHTRRILDKVGARTRAEAVARVFRADGDLP